MTRRQWIIVGIVAGLFVVFAALTMVGIWVAWRSEPGTEVRSEVGDWVELALKPAAKLRRELEAELEKIRAAGEPLTIEEMLPQDLPDSENAAVLYQQAFDELKLSEADEDALRDLLASMRQPPKAQPPPIATIEQIITDNAKAIELLEVAAKRPHCRFPIDWSEPINVELSHNARLRDCARLLAAKIVLEASHGEMTKALGSTRVSLELGEAAQADPTLISQLVRYAIQVITLRALQAALSDHSMSTRDCRALFDYLQSIDFVKSLQRTLWGERAIFMTHFDDMRQRLHENEKEMPEFLQRLRRIQQRRSRMADLPDKMFIVDEVAFLQVMSELIPIASKPWLEARDEIHQYEQKVEHLPRYCILTTMHLPVFYRVPRKRDETIARVGLAQAALALKAYKNKQGNYPDSLAELREVIPWELREDPFSGEDFIYKREGDGFLIYSLGPDLKDDGGKPLDYRAETDPPPGDIIWRCEK